jgi:hypothetical protein
MRGPLTLQVGDVSDTVPRAPEGTLSLRESQSRAPGIPIVSNGGTIRVGPLPDDAKKGREVRFPPRKVKWLIFAVTATKPGSPNVGLSEIAVFPCTAGE